ncbi:MAG: hypothetical protein GXP51_08725 [Deltaproteobacteria bacterium]|nr:hypothetical protein [Deltaproteobacteria bacterium]
MTGFRQICCLCLLLLCLFSASALYAVVPPVTGAETVLQLEQENAALQHKIRRLQRETAALRDELGSPGISQIFGGIGYIVGLFGVVGWIAARKKTHRKG